MENMIVQTFYEEEKNIVEIRYTSKIDNFAKARFYYYGNAGEFEVMGHLDSIYFIVQGEDDEKYNKIIDAHKIACEQVLKFHKVK